MSESEVRRAAIEEFPRLDALEAATRRALRQLEVWRERASASETERRRLQQVVQEMGQISGTLDAVGASEELRRLRGQNERLRRQLADGRQRAEQLASEVEFLEDAR